MIKQRADGQVVPQVLIDAADGNLPHSFSAAALARQYNALTGAALSHFEIERLGVLEHDELVQLVNNADLVL